MSIVEKAAEKLRTQQAPQAAEVATDVEPERAAPVHAGSTIERLQARLQAAAAAEEPEEAAPAPPADAVAESWHVEESNLQRAGWLPTEGDAASRLADEVRRVKRPILDNVNGRGAKPLTHAERIIVTSAVPGEGKTFTTVNLALSLALEPDFEVLLVDGDVPKADITRVFGLAERPGLMELLTQDGLRAADVIVKTDVPNLSVLPSGARHELAAELFGGRRMQRVLDELGGRNHHRLLVFDSSPLLATPEAQALVAHMGQVVVVVSAGSTGQQELATALGAMGEGQYVGLILNKSRLPATESHYYGDYYNHYGHSSHYRFQDQ